MAPSSAIRNVLGGLALALAAGHVWYLFPFPSTEAHAVVSGLLAKGAVLTSERSAELEQSLYLELVWNRVCDAVLAVAICLAGIGILSRQYRFATIAVLAYSVGNLAYAVIALDIGKWGLVPILLAQSSRLEFAISHSHFEEVLSQIFRLGSYAVSLIALPVSIWFLVGRRTSNLKHIPS